MSDSIRLLRVRRAQSARPEVYEITGKSAKGDGLVKFADFVEHVMRCPDIVVLDRSEVLASFLNFSLEDFGRLTAHNLPTERVKDGDVDVCSYVSTTTIVGNDDDELIGEVSPEEFWHNCRKNTLTEAFLPAGFVKLVLDVLDQGKMVWTKRHDHKVGVGCLPGTVVCWADNPNLRGPCDVGAEGYTGKKHFPIHSRSKLKRLHDERQEASR